MQSSIDNLAMYFNTSTHDYWLMTTLVVLVSLVLFATAVYRLAPREGASGFFRLEQFRLAAPLGGVFDDIPLRAVEPTRPVPEQPCPEQASCIQLDPSHERIPTPARRNGDPEDWTGRETA